MKSRSKKTLILLTVNIISTFLLSIGSLLVTSKILIKIGSDFNGVNSTATQLISILALVEGGFMLASQVALYSPVSKNDIFMTSKIVSYTKNKMQNIGILSLIVGVLISLVYANFIKSELSYTSILIIMIFTVLAASFNYGIVSTYKLLYQVTQTEYKIQIINILTNLILYIFIYFGLDYTENIIYIRFVYFLFEVLKGIMIILIAKNDFKYLDFNTNIDSFKVDGVSDVFISKITALLYNSAPIIFISTFISTSSASVYAVYISITNIILNLLLTIVNAPAHGLGQMLAENSSSSEKNDKVKNIYKEYELMTSYLNGLLNSVTFVMLIPFISIYTKDVTDINYLNIIYSFVIVSTSMFQIMHMPSGICINITGRFKLLRNLQVVVTIFLISSMSIGAKYFGLNGILIAKLITTLLLCILEIGIVNKQIIEINFFDLFKIYFANYIVVILLSLIEYSLIKNYFTIESWKGWIYMSGFIFIFNAMFLFLTNNIFNRSIVNNLESRIMILIKSIKY